MTRWMESSTSRSRISQKTQHITTRRRQNRLKTTSMLQRGTNTFRRHQNLAVVMETCKLRCSPTRVRWLLVFVLLSFQYVLLLLRSTNLRKSSRARFRSNLEVKVAPQQCHTFPTTLLNFSCERLGEGHWLVALVAREDHMTSSRRLILKTHTLST